MFQKGSYFTSENGLENGQEKTTTNRSQDKYSKSETPSPKCDFHVPTNPLHSPHGKMREIIYLLNAERV